MEKKIIPLEAGNGGEEMQKLIENFTKNFPKTSNWQNTNSDSATYKIDNSNHIIFTTDSYTVDPIEFPGGNIGHLAFSGTVNDLCVMGAKPIGLSIALIIEEGFDEETLQKISNSIAELSKKYDVPIVTGDTKVMEKGKLDKIIINTSGIGITENILNKQIDENDDIIISGTIADHAVALLSKRYDFETNIQTDSKPLINEIKYIKHLIKQAKDPTRGGIAASLNEIAKNNHHSIEIEEKKIPIKKEVKNACRLLGIEPLELANEGKFICICSPENSNEILEILRKYNAEAQIIGKVKEKNSNPEVILKTELGSRILSNPTGRIVPRIC